MLINKKDIIRINQEIGEEGRFSNESSLDFALSTLKQRKSWLYNLSYLTRCLLIDHVFKDGNKRTAHTIIRTVINDKNLEYDKEKLHLIIVLITKKNITDINKIMRMIKNGIIF